MPSQVLERIAVRCPVGKRETVEKVRVTMIDPSGGSNYNFVDFMLCGWPREQLDELGRDFRNPVDGTIYRRA